MVAEATRTVFLAAATVTAEAVMVAAAAVTIRGAVYQIQFCALTIVTNPIPNLEIVDKIEIITLR